MRNASEDLDFKLNEGEMLDSSAYYQTYKLVVDKQIGNVNRSMNEK